MAQQQDNFSFEQQESDSLSIREILEIGLRNWYWFVGSVTLCMVAAFLISKSTQQSYQSTALVMLKNDSKTGSQMSESMLFADMGLANTSNVVENELYVLRSISLMNSVVEDLGLDVSYSVKPLLRRVDIYGRSPIELVFPDKEISQGIIVEINPISEQKYQYNISDTKWVEADFNDTITTPQVVFVVKSTPFLNKNSIGEPVRVSVNSVESTTASLLKGLSVTRVEKMAGIINITLRDNNFQRSKDVINTLITNYNTSVLNDKNKVATSTEKFIVERLANISKDLGGIDGQIERLKRDNNITDFNSVTGVLLQTDTKYKSELISIETEINLACFVKDYLLDPTKKNELIPSNTGISDSGIEAQISAYNQERLNLNRMLSSSGPNNPMVIEMTNTLNATKANMVRSIENLLSSLNIKKAQAKSQEDISTRRIANVPTQEKQITDITRQQKIKEELYLYLLNKREENALSLAITESNAKIVQDAQGRPNPIAPSTMKYLAIGLMIGFCIPAGVIYAKKLLNTTVRDKKEIESATSISVLAELPRKPKKLEGAEIVVSAVGRDHLSESFRMLRSNMDFVLPQKSTQGQVIQFTSTTQSEGKTFVTLNLALSYAHIGKKVIMVDLDLRKASLSKLFPSQSEYGVSSYLSGSVDDIDSIIHHGIQGENIDSISVGIIPPNPTNLLISDRLDALIEYLKQKYDYIFLDSIPAMILADAKIINRVADITIYVMRSGVVDKRYLVELEDINKKNVFHNLNLIVTDIDYEKKHYGYGYGYGYYSYGDGDNYKESKK